MLRVYALSGGLIDLDIATFFAGTPPGTRWTVPVGCYLVVHPRGRLLLDTGVHPAATADPVGRLGARRAAMFRLRSGPADDVLSQLTLLGLGPDDVTWVANSHLHFDHCGGNALFPRATFLVQRAELEAARGAGGGPPGRYTPSAIDFDLPLDYRPVDGEHDVFGDGRVVLLPTFGHTPGHQSLLVRDGRDRILVLAEDACYTRANMDRDVLPTVVWDEAEMSRSLARLREWRDRRGATVVYGHDPEQWAGLPRAPAALV
jgi:glyoxylase-like metal-dependent hydrolase (beta-lactamase superfamily II)